MKLLSVGAIISVKSTEHSRQTPLPFVITNLNKLSACEAWDCYFRFNLWSSNDFGM